ncbi:MAG: hypothetical protein KDB65_03650 [Calditrichaeota bacterium]|nr:hypothetical protein [Calditrichota bacterium]MCB9368757.1 hypothetical protein [Calditrichota bacterium]
MKTLLILLLACTSAIAQMPSGRSIGFGGAYDLHEWSSDVLHGNAAILAKPTRRSWRIDLPRLSAGAANNAFSISKWNDQIAQDRYLTAADKREIIDQIPDDGLRVSGTVSVPILGGIYKQAAFQFSEETAFNVAADKELFELALYGNQLNRGYKIEDLGGEQYTIFDAGVAVGYKFDQNYLKGLYGGIGFHFYLGAFFDKITDASGELQATDSLLTGYGAIQRVHATNGDGIGFDLGLLAELNDQWSVGAALKQIGGSITWVVDEATLDAFEIDSTGLIVDSLDDEDYVSRAFQSSSDAVTGGNVESKIPTILEFSGRYQYSPKLMFVGTLRGRLEASAQGKTGVEVSTGGEYKIAGPWVARCGLGTGGPLRTRFSIGTGIETSHYSLDLGASWHDGFFSSTRGLSFGISHALYW